MKSLWEKKVLIVLDLTFEAFVKHDSCTDKAEFYVQTHCLCESTFSSGQWLPTIEAGVELARESLVAHETKYACGRQTKKAS